MELFSSIWQGLEVLPWAAMALAVLLSLALAALGFKRVEYFVSIGYAASIAAQAVAMPFLYRNTISGWALFQSLLLLTYGLRLGSFLILRERNPTFQKERAINADRGARVTGATKIAIWFGVAVLYMLMYLPALLTLSAQFEGLSLPSLWIGTVIMVAGLAVEAEADREKSRFKSSNPTRFCDVGLFRMVRFPNYFGEMLFWFGVWSSGISAYQTWGAWVLATLGFILIQLVMLGSGRRLEQKQKERYSANPAFQAYARRVPVLFPLLPLYSLRSLRIYLG